LLCALIVTGMTGADVKADAAAGGESVSSISETDDAEGEYSKVNYFLMGFSLLRSSEYFPTEIRAERNKKPPAMRVRVK
jgi:hypothetical protein